MLGLSDVVRRYNLSLVDMSHLNRWLPHIRPLSFASTRLLTNRFERLLAAQPIPMPKRQLIPNRCKLLTSYSSCRAGCMKLPLSERELRLTAHSKTFYVPNQFQRGTPFSPSEALKSFAPLGCELPSSLQNHKKYLLWLAWLAAAGQPVKK